MNRFAKPALRALPAAGWCCLIWSFSAQPATASGALSDGLLYRVLSAVSAVFRLQTPEGQAAVVEFLSFYARKAAHMFLYFVLCALLLWALAAVPTAFRASPRPAPFFLRRQGLLALGLCAAWAAADEFHQTFVPGRSGELRDVAVDVCGAALFLLLFALVRCLLRGFQASRAGKRGWERR